MSKIKVFADGAKLEDFVELNKRDDIHGFTTNPTLMKKAGVTNYLEFAKQVLAEVQEKPVSFEVIADDFAEMERQAKVLSSLGKNVYIKIPITNTKGESSLGLIRTLLDLSVKVNITAVFTKEQLDDINKVIDRDDEVIVSVFAGRIADTMVDPLLTMRYAYGLFYDSRVELLWASTREIYNLKQAIDTGCDIITIPPSIIKKKKLAGKDLKEFSLETVKMFYKDASSSGLEL